MSFTLFINRIKQTGVILFLDFFTYVGSVVTILSVYYDKNKFEIGNIIDWIIILFCLIVFIIWLIKAIKLLSTCNYYSLNKNDFFDYINKEKSKATNSIINIAGDVSWLNDQKEPLKKLKEDNQNIDITIFYDHSKVCKNENILSTINEYEESNIKLIKYPFENLPHLKSLLIDNNTEDTKFFVFSKKNEKYNVNIFHNNDISLNYANAFIKSIESFYILKQNEIKSKKIIIGISGINNIGKTTLASNLKTHYNNDINIVQDTFTHECPSTFEAAVCALCQQMILFQNTIYTSKAKIILFDRTPIDNLALIYLRKLSGSPYNSFINSIKDNILTFTNQFDFIALLKPDEKDFTYKDTTHLKKQTRKLLRRKIEDIYTESLVTPTKYTTIYETNNYQDRILQISKEIENKIQTIIKLE